MAIFHLEINPIDCHDGQHIVCLVLKDTIYGIRIKGTRQTIILIKAWLWFHKPWMA